MPDQKLTSEKSCMKLASGNSSHPRHLERQLFRRPRRRLRRGQHRSGANVIKLFTDVIDEFS
jgi:hypothetical protein